MAEFVSIGLIPRPIPTYPEHHHGDTWELCLYTAGHGVATVGGHEIAFAPGTLIAMPPRVPHRERSTAGFTNIFLHLRDWVPTASGVPVVSDDANGSYRRIAEQLHREFSLQQPGWRPICQQLCDVLLRYVARWTEASHHPELVDRLKHLLATNLHRPDWSVGEAMRQLACSPDHARRRFVRATGQTPSAYLTNLRLAAAKHHLVAGATVADAAERAGFADPYYFSRVFARAVGRPPSAYARETTARAESSERA